MQYFPLPMFTMISMCQGPKKSMIWQQYHILYINKTVSGLPLTVISFMKSGKTQISL